MTQISPSQCMSEYELITFQIIQQFNIQCAQNHKFDIHIQNEIIILFPHQYPTRTEQREEYEFVKSPTSTTTNMPQNLSAPLHSYQNKLMILNSNPLENPSTNTRRKKRILAFPLKFIIHAQFDLGKHKI